MEPWTHLDHFTDDSSAVLTIGLLFTQSHLEWPEVNIAQLAFRLRGQHHYVLMLARRLKNVAFTIGFNPDLKLYSPVLCSNNL